MAAPVTNNYVASSFLILDRVKEVVNVRVEEVDVTQEHCS